MGVVLSGSDIHRQSKIVFSQMETKWKAQARTNFGLPHRPAAELRNSGIGKQLLLVAMGSSLEDQVEIIKKNRDKVDVVVCDKGFGPLLDHGVKADYVVICDANIPVKHMQPYFNETKDVKLLSTVYANPEWTTQWQGNRYFYINRDAIESEFEFYKIFGRDTRSIPAGSNVSNGMLIFFVGYDDKNQANWSGYERYLLAGYDYSWKPDGNYYAWANPVPKRHYLCHRTLLDFNNDVVFTSENLLFSAKWLYSYITSFNLPVLNCSGRGLLDVKRGVLEREMQALTNDRAAQQRVQAAFRAARDAHLAAAAARESFELSRGELYVSRR